MNEMEQIFKIKQVFEHFDWFEMLDIVDNKIIFYVNYMSKKVFDVIPDSINSKQVLVHFYCSKMADKNFYTKVYNYEDFVRDSDIQDFISDNMKIYGRTVLGCMFYEVYNPNSGTSLKTKYPHLHTETTNICEKYGYMSVLKELEKQNVVS